MEREMSPDPGWQALITDLSAELSWNLDLAEISSYSRVLREYVSAGAGAAEVRRICIYYHQDHRLVAALMNRAHPLHCQIWAEWTQQALQMLYKAGFARIGDHAVSAEDLAQASLVELARSLPRFQFRSRLSTWAHTVVVQTARRMLRDSRAQKRPRNLASFDQSPELDAPIPDAEQPEAEASAHVLLDLVSAVLAHAGDDRLAYIFYLSAVDDLPSDEIGRLVHLHPSRVRALLAQARALLQQHPSLQSWLASVDTPASR